MSSFSFHHSRGHALPLGTSRQGNGVNFAVVSSQAKSLSLRLFKESNRNQPYSEIALHPVVNKTGNVWHIHVDDVPVGFFYLFYVNDMPLLDPYAKGIETSSSWGQENYKPLSVIDPFDDFDWADDAPPSIPKKNLVIYEMHVRGFSRHPSSQVQHPGTFLGIIEKIPYLKDLGINAIELMPIYEFDEGEYTKHNPQTQERLYNYWGYSTVNFFSPMQRYTAGPSCKNAIADFKTLVKELHRAGIEVILDVVYNHTAEGNSKGPLMSYKGLDNALYYLLDHHGDYQNFSGCGNTFSCNQPIAAQLIIDSLRYWVTEMHVDGFRFDLASILARNTAGHPTQSSPILEFISADPILSKVKLIAEPWDAAGLYQVGAFFQQSTRWSEWNGRYRDVVRRFLKGSSSTGDFMTNICGSQDMYNKFSPSRSINFITSHDGFSLSDLVAYDAKHNLANGENNRDGLNHNDSWNCGVEGITDNQTVLELRERQMRNFHAALFLSRGIPLILMGDEYGHSKQGNNNTWCQDNELSWFLWDQLEKNNGFYRFNKLLINFRKQHDILLKDQFFEKEDIDWHGTSLLKPNWSPDNRFIAYTLKDRETKQDLYIAFNVSKNTLEVTLPSHTNYFNWHWVMNTANGSPNDFNENYSSPECKVSNFLYKMPPFSAIMLKAIPYLP